MNVFQGRLAVPLLLSCAIVACSKQPPASEPARSAAGDTPAEHALKHTDP